MQIFLKKICRFLPLLIGVLVISSVSDPAEIAQEGRYERQAARTLLEGKDLRGAHDCNERLLQSYLIAGLNRKYDVVTIGSSRSLQLAAPFFPGRSFFNNSVSGATLEDHLAVLELYRRRGMLPNTLVIGLDPWILNRNNGQTRWQTLEEPFYSLKKQLGFAVPLTKSAFLTRSFAAIDRYLELVSPAYFQASVHALNKRIASLSESERGWSGESAVKRSDGSIEYDKKTRERTAVMIAREADEFMLREPVYSLGSFSDLDSSYSRLLEAFVAFAQRECGEVIFFLPPFHPRVYAFLAESPRYRLITAAESYFRELARRKGIRVIGSFDPLKLQLGGTDFYDGMHPKGEVLARIFGSRAGNF